MGSQRNDTAAMESAAETPVRLDEAIAALMLNNRPDDPLAGLDRSAHRPTPTPDDDDEDEDEERSRGPGGGNIDPDEDEGWSEDDDDDDEDPLQVRPEHNARRVALPVWVRERIRH
jgi:hypothetical protein